MKFGSTPTDMLNGKPFGLLMRFAIPLLIGNLFQQMYNIVDSLVVGNFIGTEALAAVGIGDRPVRVLLAIFMGIGTGATIRISHYVGASNRDGVRKVIQTANSMMLIVSIPLTIIGLLLAAPVLQWMNTPPEVMPEAVPYLSVVFLGVVSLLGYNLNAGILRGLGDSQSSLLFLIIATFVNIGLDLLFVAVFGWGVAGAAWATTIAMTTAWVLSIIFINKQYPAYASKVWPLKIDKEALGDMLRLGLPIGFNDALFSLGHVLLSSQVNRYGAAFAAGYVVGNKVDALSFMPIASFSAATTTYVGQNVGAKRYDRVKAGARTALLITFVWNVVGAALMLLFGHHLVGIFDSSPEVVEVGYAYILRLEPFYWIYGIMFILNAVMNGAGEVRMPMIANLVLFWGVRLPVAYLLMPHLPPNDFFYCYPISWAGGLVVSLAYYLTGRWKRHFKKEEALT